MNDDSETIHSLAKAAFAFSVFFLDVHPHQSLAQDKLAVGQEEASKIETLI
jgi:hypothetical protein